MPGKAPAVRLVGVRKSCRGAVPWSGGPADGDFAVGSGKGAGGTGSRSGREPPVSVAADRTAGEVRRILRKLAVPNFCLIFAAV